MSEAIESVAKAICKSRTCEGFSCCQWPAQGGRTQCPVKAGGYDDAARAALDVTMELAAQKVEGTAGNGVYQAAWRSAAKMLRALKY